MSKNKINKDDLENDFSRHNNSNEFPLDVFPKIIEETLIKIKETFDFSQDYLGAGALASFSAAIGNSFKLKFKTNWIEKANLFMIIVGNTGDAKTHVIKMLFHSLQKKDKVSFKKYAKKYIEMENSKDSKKVIEYLRRYLINDFTPESLINNLSNNKKGLYILVDELNGWLKNFNRYTSSGEVEFYLSLWSGTVITVDRVSKKSIRIDDPFVGIIGSAQIKTLKAFASNGKDFNGFIDRFLFVFPKMVSDILWNLNEIDDSILDNYYKIIDKIIEIREKKSTPIELQYTKEAKEYLVKWQNNRPRTFFFEYERSIEKKLQQYVIRFSLILQVVEQVTNNKAIENVELKAVKGAIKLFNYFRENAIKVREEISPKDYRETLTELQKEILSDLPEKFKTAEGIEKACIIVDGNKPRISVRQFKTYLNDKKLFKRVSHGNYEKVCL